jgi:hypothetical protein
LTAGKAIPPALAALIGAAMLLLPSGSAWAADTAVWSGNINFFAGGKFLDGGDWRPASNQAEAGVSVDLKKEGWPVSLAAAFLFSAMKGRADIYLIGDLVHIRTEVFAKTVEVDFGARKIWEPDEYLRLFAGGGVALVHAQWKTDIANLSFDVEDSGFGWWLGGGLYWTIHRRLNLGLEGRWSTAQVTIARRDIDAGGLHVGATVGYHW